MADQAPGAPNIIIKGAFDEPKKMELDSNRLDQQKETGWEFLQRIALPASVIELQIQALSYLFAGWFAVGLLIALIDARLFVVVAVALLAIIPSVAIAGWLSERYKNAALFIRYRLLLLFFGGVLGVAPLSVLIQYVKELFNHAN